MKLLPYDKLCIVTSFSPAEVQDRLQLEVKEQEGFSFKNLFSTSSDKYFSGYVTNGNFEFKRIITYRNSFLPIIKGQIRSWPNGTIVYVKMGLHPAVAVFMCIWLGGVGAACISILISGMLYNDFTPAMLIPFGMFAFGYALTMGGYLAERNKAKDKLLEILAGQIDDAAAFRKENYR
jgi:hypothetical protein